MSPEAQTMKTGPDALGTVANESGSAKHENGIQRPPYRPKRVWERKSFKQESMPSWPPQTSPGAQNMKIGLMPSVPPQTSPGAQNMKTGSVAHDTAQNESESAKHENGTRRTRYRRKRVKVCKTCKRDTIPSVPSKNSSREQKIKNET
jgi:hypothetical protein